MDLFHCLFMISNAMIVIMIPIAIISYLDSNILLRILLWGILLEL